MAGSSRYEQMKKGPLQDYTDYAYKEAVSRLRSMMTDSYMPPQNKFSYSYAPAKGDDSDEESGVSITVSDTTRVAQLGAFRKPFQTKMSPTVTKRTPPVLESTHPATSLVAPPEMMGFIEKQEEYIEQLEKESQYCRDELSQLVGKVKDLIAENEALHQQQKSGLFKATVNCCNCSNKSERIMPDAGESRLKPYLEGPNIVFESRISELEAQLTQARLEVKKAQDDAATYKRKSLDNDPTSNSSDYYRQIETLHREKKELSDALNRVQASAAQMRDRESEASRKVLRTQDIAEKAQMDRQQAELEVQRLKSELELQHERLLDLLSDQTRKVGEERSHAERRYLQHVEQLNTELGLQRDSATKLQLDLEKHQRVEEDLRRDVAAKTATIDAVRKELNSKIVCMQNELSIVLSERDSLEQELNGIRMSGERTELVSKQESSRLQVEVNALRQRISKTDNDLMQTRRENLRLAEQIASQEKEIIMYKIKIGEMELNDDGTPKKSELEGLVEKQSQAMSALTQQCHSLAQRLEDATLHHQQEMAELQTNLEFLNGRLESSITSRQWQGDPVPELQDDRFNHQPIVYEEPYTENTERVQEQVPYQIDETQSNPLGSTSFPGQLQALTETRPENIPVSPSRPDSRNTASEKPNLSRSSSRGERSESPLIGKESRKNPLQRRESRLQLQQRTPPSGYVPAVLEEEYNPPPNQLDYAAHDGGTGLQRNDYNITDEYQPTGNFEQAYQPEEHQKQDDFNYDSREIFEPQDQYQQEQSSSTYAANPYEYSEGQSGQARSSDFMRNEPAHDASRSGPDRIGNRTPSRESLQSSYQNNSQACPSHDQYRQNSSQDYQSGDLSEAGQRDSSPQGYQISDQVRQSSPQGQMRSSSSEFAAQDQRYSPQQESYNPNQHYQQSSPQRQLASENIQPPQYVTDPPVPNNPRLPPTNSVQEPSPELKAADAPKSRQTPTLRKEPSTVSMRNQQRTQQKNLPTKFPS